MDQQLKQRLVGVAVIFLLAVIFVPMLLDGAGTRPQPVEVDIPQQPSVETYEVLEPSVIELKREVATMPELQPRVVDELTEPPKSATEKAAADAASEASKKQSPPTVAKASGSAADGGKSATLANSKMANSPAPIKVPVKKAVAKKNEVIKTEVKKTKVKKPVVNQPVVKQPVAAGKPRAGGESWIIQVGSFNDRNKAYQLRDKLRKSRIARDVFIEKFPHDGKISYRVRLGMFLSRSKAAVVVNKLRAKYNIKGFIQQYDK